jgi:NAD(P)-dependent dehydrogenase (short-subunit alcohol dehydrogenase family)
MKLPDVTSRTVIITGCSTGIGASAALHLRERGWDVIPTARKAEDLDRLRQEGFDPVSMDMADADSVAAGAETVLQRTNGTLGALVNNAGFGQSGALEDLKRDHLRYQFEVNVFGLQDLTNRFIPVFRRQRYGRIVHISSVVGRVSLPFLGAYSASKFAVEALADAQRVELARSGVGVILVEPGPIITDFRRTASKRASETLDYGSAAYGAFYDREIQRRADSQKKPDWINKSPEDVAKVIAHALESPRPKRRYKITFPAYFGAWMSRFAPDTLLDAIMSRKLPPVHEP